MRWASTFDERPLEYVLGAFKNVEDQIADLGGKLRRERRDNIVVPGPSGAELCYDLGN
jgi:hypothetical protein